MRKVCSPLQTGSNTQLRGDFHWREVQRGTALSEDCNDLVVSADDIPETNLCATAKDGRVQRRMPLSVAHVNAGMAPEKFLGSGQLNA
jgi:hypothetical protein